MPAVAGFRMAAPREAVEALLPTPGRTSQRRCSRRAASRPLVASHSGGSITSTSARAAAAGASSGRVPPDVLTDATADLAWALILAVARRIREGEALVRSGSWDGWKPQELLGVSLQGKTLGIYGMGRIGRAVARRGEAFG